MFDCPLATNTSPMYTVFRWNTVWSPYATVSSYGVSLAGSASSVAVNRLFFTVAFPARRVPSPVSVTVIAEASTSPSCRAISPLSVIGASRCVQHGSTSVRDGSAGRERPLCCFLG